MAESSGRPLKCQFHDRETYKYFCKQCKECICPQCIDEFHEDHTFCRLKSAESDICSELKVVVQESTENDKSIQCLNKTLNEIDNNMCIKKEQLVTQIEAEMDKLILSINESKQKTLNTLDELFNGRKAFVDAQKAIIGRLNQRIAEIDFDSIDLTDAVELVMTTRTAFSAIADFTDGETKIHFVGNDSDITIGQLKGIELGQYHIEAESGVVSDNVRVDAQVLKRTNKNSPK